MRKRKAEEEEEEIVKNEDGGMEEEGVNECCTVWNSVPYKVRSANIFRSS